MTQRPALEQYPGYFPAAKAPFWSRRKTGIAAAFLGIIVGAGFGSSGATPTSEATPAPTDIESEPTNVEAKIEAAVEDALAEQRGVHDNLAARQRARSKERMAARLAKADSRATRAQRVAVAAAVDKAVKKAVQKTRGDERARADRMVAEARALVSAAAPPPAPVSSTDPRFNYCYEAQDAGYGSYRRGEPEYDWYDDADNDGVVCE